MTYLKWWSLVHGVRAHVHRGEAVSYTHLDVYKRQPLQSGPRSQQFSPVRALEVVPGRPAFQQRRSGEAVNPILVST